MASPGPSGSACETARLTFELAEAHRYEAATAGVPRVIGSPPTDLQPVFDTAVGSAVALFQFDGELLHVGAHHNFSPEALQQLHHVYPARAHRAMEPPRATLKRAVIHIPDVEVDPKFVSRTVSRAIGWRNGTLVPKPASSRTRDERRGGASQ